jgi:hypothetical protein
LLAAKTPNRNCVKPLKPPVSISSTKRVGALGRPLKEQSACGKGQYCLGECCVCSAGVKVGVLATSLILFNRAGPKLAGDSGVRLGLKSCPAATRRAGSPDCLFMQDPPASSRPSHASHRRRYCRCLSRTDSPIRVCRFDSPAFKLLLRRQPR